MSIAAAVLDAVQEESRRRGGARILKVGIQVGELSGVEPESLRFCFEVLVAGSEAGPMTLDIERPAGPELMVSWLEIEDRDAPEPGTESS